MCSAMDLVYQTLLHMIASVEVVMEHVQKQYVLDHTHTKTWNPKIRNKTNYIFWPQGNKYRNKNRNKHTKLLRKWDPSSENTIEFIV